MNLRRLIFSLVALLSVALSGAAWADRGGGFHGGGHFRGGGHFHGGHHFRGGGFGLFIGAPLFWPGYPGYYYPPAVAVPYAPPVYMEQGDDVGDAPAQSPAQSPAYWYYCADSKAYYPYVKTCPSQWQRVLAQPPA